MTRMIWAVVIGLLVLTGCQNDNHDNNPELRVSAASSLTGLLKKMEKDYEADTGNDLIFNFGSSGTLVQQISQGAPVDIYISASEYWMNNVIEKGLMDEQSVESLMTNRLVLAVNEHAEIKLKDLASDDVSKVAIGDPDSVPAGMYAKQALESIGLWEHIKDKLVYGKNVRQVAAYVESGNVDAGFVYESDVIQADKLSSAAQIANEHHTNITYPAGIVEASTQKQAAEDFLQYLKSDEAGQVIKIFGFEQ